MSCILQIFANIWYSDVVIVINPSNGAVESLLNLNNLLGQQYRTGGENVLNGIAYNHDLDRFYFTGKKWGYMFEIEIDVDIFSPEL